MNVEIEPLGVARVELASTKVDLAAILTETVPTGPVGPAAELSFSILTLTPDSGHDLNQSSWTAIPWASVLNTDAAFSYDLSSDPTTITVEEDGWYDLSATVGYESVSSSRINVKIRLYVNGSPVEGEAKGNYSRDRENSTEGSSYIERSLNLSAGDTIQVRTKQEASNGTATIDPDGTVLEIESLVGQNYALRDADTLEGYAPGDFLLADSSDLDSTSGVAIYDGSKFVISDFYGEDPDAGIASIDATIESGNYTLAEGDVGVFAKRGESFIYNLNDLNSLGLTHGVYWNPDKTRFEVKGVNRRGMRLNLSNDFIKLQGSQKRPKAGYRAKLETILYIEHSSRRVGVFNENPNARLHVNGDAIFRTNIEVKARSGQTVSLFELRDENGNAGLTVNPLGNKLSLGASTTQPGSASDPALEIGDNGAGVFVNSNGELVGVDEAGNTTVLT